MKKALIALLSLAVAGVLVAQDAPSLKFSGSLQTGVIYDMGDDVADPVLKSVAEDAGKDDYRLRLQGLYENGDAGLKFRLSSATAAAAGVTTDFAWGWVNLFDGMALVSSGYAIDNNSWRTTGDGEFDYEGTGLKVEVKPMDGLNLGFGVLAAAAGTELDVTPYVLGVKYDVAPITFAAGAKLVEELQSVYAGVTYAGVENVSLSFEGKVDVLSEVMGFATGAAGLSDYSDFGRTTLVQTVSYTKDALEAGVKAYEFLYGSDDIDMGLKITPWVAYTMDKNTFKLEVTYNNDEYEIDELANYLVEEEYSTLTFKPTVTTKFTDKAKLVTGYKYVAMTDMAADNSQQFFLNFIFEF